MDFTQNQEEAKTWVEGSSFKIISSEEEEGKITFGIGETGFSFYVLKTQNSGGKTEWMVWSDCENILSYLSNVQDLPSTTTISRVLDRAKMCLQPVLSEDKESDDDDDDDEMEEDLDDYYGGEELDDMVVQSATGSRQEDSGEEGLEESFFMGGGDPAAVQRLMKDLRSFKKDSEMFGISGGPRGDDLFVWDIQLKDIPESKLLKDLTRYAEKYNTEPVINMEMHFPRDYPMSPPFVRVIKPRFKFLTGHVTIGGSICMEMLTKSGWRPTNDIENILVQIRCEILSDPNAQLDLNNANQAYTDHEAKDAFRRMVQRYGWDK